MMIYSYVVFLIGAGTKNKIIQAGMTGLPIISTSLGVEGLNNNIKKEIYIANNEEEFINEIRKVQEEDTNILERKIKLQQEMIKKYNSMDIIAEKLTMHIQNGSGHKMYIF